MRRTALRLLGVALMLHSCAAPAPDDQRLLVVATVSPVTNLVDNLAGGAVRLTGLVPQGVDSHTFEPAPGDARLLSQADLVFINGLHLEEPVRRLAEANLKAGARLVALGESATNEEEWIYDFSFPEDEGFPNPHLWTNPPHAAQYAELISQELSRADPDNAARYQANLGLLLQRIEALDLAIREATATVPPENRRLLTYHDSFPYFAREYGWEVIGAIQPSDFSEPTPREVARLIEQIRDLQVPAIFGSEVFPSPVLEQIARESGAIYVEDLRDDDLPGSPGDPEHSYIGMMKANLILMVEALGGDPSAMRALDAANLVESDAAYR